MKFYIPYKLQLSSPIIIWSYSKEVRYEVQNNYLPYLMFCRPHFDFPQYKLMRKFERHRWIDRSKSTQFIKGAQNSISTLPQMSLPCFLFHDLAPDILSSWTFSQQHRHPQLDAASKIPTALASILKITQFIPWLYPLHLSPATSIFKILLHSVNLDC